MSDPVFLFFNWWGLLFLALFAAGFGFSHVLAVKGSPSIDFILRNVAFIALIRIFMFSGWKTGLVALPIGFLVSILGATNARSLTKGMDTNYNHTK